MHIIIYGHMHFLLQNTLHTSHAAYKAQTCNYAVSTMIDTYACTCECVYA